MANYCVEPGLIKRFVPDGTEPDTVNGKYFVSLVGFLFDKVRVKGIALPFHQRFPEVNLRLYVRRRSGDEWKRGVVFIREIVPKPAITFIANTMYGEHYTTMPMKDYHFCDNEKQIVRYSWKTKGKWNSLGVESDISATGLWSIMFHIRAGIFSRSGIIRWIVISKPCTAPGLNCLIQNSRRVYFWLRGQR